MKSFPRYVALYHNCKDVSNRALLFDESPSLASLWQRAKTYEEVFCIVDNCVLHLVEVLDGVYQLRTISLEEILELFSVKMTSVRRVKL